MSDTQEPIRQRTAARMRFVAPPGMSLNESGRKTIGRYEVIRTLGKGAMGVVYKARDPLLDRVVAVKTIVAPRGGSKRVHAAYIERFKREAKAAAKMQHPAIVTIFDVGIDDEAPFMVLEYLPGETLADRLDRVRLPLIKAVQIATDLGNALAFAHRQRIVHRDVKPANVLHAGDNRWKLADFGIARLPDSDLTQVGIFMGTPGYSPPESIRFGHYTAQADVFAWGAVLYEMLSGRIPYEGPDTRTTNGYVIKATAPSPRTYDPSIPEPLAEVVMTALNPSAADRYKDGAAAEQALREAWEMCLRNNLVPASSLVGEEVPHDQVSGQMHLGSKTSVSAALPASVSLSASPPIPQSPPPMPPQSPPPAAKAPMLIIEPTTGRATDDAPTQVLVRDGLASRSMGAPGDPDSNPGSQSAGQSGVLAPASSGSAASEQQPGAAAAGKPASLPGVPETRPMEASGNVPGFGQVMAHADTSASGAVPRPQYGHEATAPVRAEYYRRMSAVGALLSNKTGLGILIAVVVITIAAVIAHLVAN